MSSPVWIAPLTDGSFGFTTGSDSGKVKRIRNFPEVTLRPCDRSGKVSADAPTWKARAEILVGSAAEPVQRAVASKYGWQYRLVVAMSAVQKLLRRGTSGDSAIVLRVGS